MALFKHIYPVKIQIHVLPWGFRDPCPVSLLTQQVLLVLFLLFCLQYQLCPELNDQEKGHCRIVCSIPLVCIDKSTYSLTYPEYECIV